MYLLAYRTSRHETTGVTPTELYFARELRLPLDLLGGSTANEELNSEEGFVRNLKEKLYKIHFNVRKSMNMKSSRVKSWYDQKARKISFQVGQKVWFYNPGKMIGRAPKLQRSWEGPFIIVKRLNDVVFCIQKLVRHKKKVVHADKLALFTKRQLV